jgi:hypothetical protein
MSTLRDQAVEDEVERQYWAFDYNRNKSKQERLEFKHAVYRVISFSNAKIMWQVLTWLAKDEFGMSSMAMALTACGIKVNNTYHPADPSDFDRCLQLLATAPLIRNHMDRVAAISPQWKAIVERWAEVEECHLDEVGLGWSKGRKLLATKTYELMQEIYKGGQ